MWENDQNNIEQKNAVQEVMSAQDIKDIASIKNLFENSDSKKDWSLKKVLLMKKDDPNRVSHAANLNVSQDMLDAFDRIREKMKFDMDRNAKDKDAISIFERLHSGVVIWAINPNYGKYDKLTKAYPPYKDDINTSYRNNKSPYIFLQVSPWKSAQSDQHSWKQWATKEFLFATSHLKLKNNTHDEYAERNIKTVKMFADKSTLDKLEYLMPNWTWYSYDEIKQFFLNEKKGSVLEGEESFDIQGFLENNEAKFIASKEAAQSRLFIISIENVNPSAGESSTMKNLSKSLRAEKNSVPKEFLTSGRAFSPENIEALRLAYNNWPDKFYAKMNTLWWDVDYDAFGEIIRDADSGEIKIISPAALKDALQEIYSKIAFAKHWSVDSREYNAMVMARGNSANFKKEQIILLPDGGRVTRSWTSSEFYGLTWQSYTVDKLANSGISLADLLSPSFTSEQLVAKLK